MKQRWTTRALLLALAAGVAPAVNAAPSDMLTKMECLSTQVEDVTAEEEKIEITTSLLESYLITGVREKLPRIPVEESCNNIVYLNVSMVRGANDPGPALYYSTRVRLELRRLATLADSNKQGIVTVWDSEAFVIGEKVEVQHSTLETIGELIGGLAVDVRDSGGF